MKIRKIIREELKKVFEADYYDRYPDFMDPLFNPLTQKFPPTGMHRFGALVKEYGDEEDDEEYDEYKPEIESTEYHGLAYHGTNISLDEDEEESLFNEFSSDYSDWGAVWFGDDESVAQAFSGWHERENSIKVIYEVQMDTDKLAYIHQHTASELSEFYGCEDLRECIGDLENLGYDGWRAMGSIDRMQYEDYAIFDLSVVTMNGVSVQLGENEWSDYMSIEKADELIRRAKARAKQPKKVIREEMTQINEIPDNLILVTGKRDGGNDTFMILFDIETQRIQGMIAFQNREGDNWISVVAGEKGYGPLMYEMAMMYSSPKGIMPTRTGDVADKSKNIWIKFFNRDDIKKEPVDPGQVGMPYQQFLDDEDGSFEIDKMTGIFNTKYYKSPTPEFHRLVRKSQSIIKNNNLNLEDIINRGMNYFSANYKG